MAERELISGKRLVEIMNAELAKSDVCQDCQIADHILRLREPDEDGCDWSDNIIIRCSGRSISLDCCRAALRVVGEARRLYNVSD